MYDFILLAVIAVTYLILVVVTLTTVTILERLYCNCKPDYRFTDYLPSSRRAYILLPLILPLLLIELVYITTYCIVRRTWGRH